MPTCNIAISMPLSFTISAEFVLAICIVHAALGAALNLAGRIQGISGFKRL